MRRTAAGRGPAVWGDQAWSPASPRPRCLRCGGAQEMRSSRRVVRLWLACIQVGMCSRCRTCFFETSTLGLLQDGEPTAAADGTTDSSGDGCSGGQLTSSVLDIINSLYGASKPAAEAASGPAVDGDKSSDLPAGEASAAAALDAVGSVSQAAADGAGCDSVQQHAADDVDVQDSTQQACEEAESAAPEGDDDSPGSDPLADSSAAPPPTTTSNTALLAAIDGGLAERSRLQQELSGYLQQLGSRSDGEGAPLVVLADGGEYALLVERLLREGRAQHYRALDGWEGPHR